MSISDIPSWEAKVSLVFSGRHLIRSTLDITGAISLSHEKLSALGYGFLLSGGPKRCLNKCGANVVLPLSTLIFLLRFKIISLLCQYLVAQKKWITLYSQSSLLLSGT